MVSLEVTDENGLSIGPGFRSINLFGRAVQFSASARFGGATNLEANLKDPNFAGDHLSYDLQFFQRDRTNKLDDFAEISTEIGTRLGSYWGEHGRIGGLLNFLSLGSDVDGITNSPDNRDNLPKLGVFLGYDSRDLATNPHVGWWNEADVAKTGGDGDYWTFNFDVRRYQPIVRRHTLALFSLTTLQTGEVGKEIPEYMDFHIGGTNTVRGWHFNSQKGKNQFLNTIEYRYTVFGPRAFSVKGFNLQLGIQLAAFGDLGLAWNHSNEFKTNNFIDGYGFGIRLLVPFVNVIRMDFGFGEPGEGMNFHFALWEKPVMQRARVR
jgi:outer membrane protein assembly factor BamA